VSRPADRPALRRGQHPTQSDLDFMRLGYPGYDGRLDSMRALNPARYAAVMSAAKTFIDPGWRCSTCGGSERATRNLACRGCLTARVPKVFHKLPHGQAVYVPVNDEASENWQTRHQRTQRLLDQQHTLGRLGALEVAPYALAGGRVMRAGAVVLDTEPLMLAVDALLSTDPVQIRAVLTPLLAQSRELVHLVRLIATAISKPQNPRK
jgi:hypothetical protein